MSTGQKSICVRSAFIEKGKGFPMKREKLGGMLEGNPVTVLEGGQN